MSAIAEIEEGRRAAGRGTNARSQRRSGREQDWRVNLVSKHIYFASLHFAKAISFVNQPVPAQDIEI